MVDEARLGIVLRGGGGAGELEKAAAHGTRQRRNAAEYFMVGWLVGGIRI